MANQLKMAAIESILLLHQRGWSNRQIAESLGLHRDTVARQLRRAKQAGAPTARAAAPTTAPEAPKQAGAPIGSDPPAAVGEAALQASLCEPFRAVILAKLEAGLTAQRIYQDLVGEHGFAGKYHSVRRFVRRLGAATVLPFRRLECAPGEEAQVDFGTGIPITSPDGKRRRTHVFRIVLSHSRKGYSEAVYRQTTDDFIRCLENAFHHFGGVPQTLVLDNLKAGVVKPDWFDPDVNPKLRAFAEHYGLALLPTRPRTPRHKGKIESGVGYVKGNALKDHTFTSLEGENRHLLDWETTVADRRIHGTIRKQVGQVFAEVERPALRPLPLERFPFFHEGRRIVHRDGYIEVAKAYYSTPPEYLTRTVWVRWDGRLVRIFNARWEQLAVYLQSEPGRFNTQASHIPAEKISGVERGAGWLLRRIGRLGPHCTRWGESVLAARGVEGIRVLQGLLSLANRHPSAALEKACEIAVSYGSYRLRTVRELLQRQAPKQEQFAFMEEHDIIRSLSEYGQLVEAVVRQEARP